MPGPTAGLSSWTGSTYPGNQWPSFWANSVDPNTGAIGIETDIVEQMAGTEGHYGSTVINWQQPSADSNRTGYGQDITAPNGNTLHGANTYGMLWIPATATTGGSLTFFLNGNPVGQPITWTQANPGTYGSIDQQKMTLYFGAGGNSPATFSNIQVWQASTAGNSLNGGPAPSIAPQPADACQLVTQTPVAVPVAPTAPATALGDAPPSSRINPPSDGSSAPVIDPASPPPPSTTVAQAEALLCGQPAWKPYCQATGITIPPPTGTAASSALAAAEAETPQTPGLQFPAPLASASPSPDGTTVAANSGGSVTDAAGNVWTITSGGQVAINGKADPTTNIVAKVAVVNGVVWQQNTMGLWWYKSSPTAFWEQLGGTPVSPFQTPLTSDQIAANATASDQLLQQAEAALAAGIPLTRLQQAAIHALNGIPE